ncbi:MAG: cation:proton antiporter [Candidatus Brocadiae bacterium]|nr:cation:proton antiporter [Candidatus Brocadiia bacterium]
MSAFEQTAFGVLMFASLLCLYRIGRGPTAPDRTIAIDILGTLVVGFCCIMAIWTGREFYMNIAIAWALISFIGTLALAKYLEGRCYDA